MNRTTLFIFSFISIVMHASIFAGNRPGALTLTPATGYEFFAKKRHIDNTRLGAIMLGYDLTDHWGIEAYLGFFHTQYRGSINDNRQIRGTLFNVDGIYHFKPGKIIEPYLLAGVGITGLNPSRTDANNEGNINGAIGLQLFVAKSIAFRLETRDIYTIAGGKNDVIINAGLSVLFDLC